MRKRTCDHEDVEQGYVFPRLTTRTFRFLLGDTGEAGLQELGQLQVLLSDKALNNNKVD